MAEQAVEVNVTCCASMNPTVDRDCDDPTVFEVVCTSCMAALAFIIDRKEPADEAAIEADLDAIFCRTQIPGREG